MKFWFHHKTGKIDDMHALELIGSVDELGADFSGMLVFPWAREQGQQTVQMQGAWRIAGQSLWELTQQLSVYFYPHYSCSLSSCPVTQRECSFSNKRTVVLSGWLEPKRLAAKLGPSGCDGRCPVLNCFFVNLEFPWMR